jgi:predicted transcriptional regulator
MLAKSTTAKPKQTALKAIKHLRDSASYEEMMYELYVLQKIERGREELRTGRTVSHTEARERLGKWVK